MFRKIFPLFAPALFALAASLAFGQAGDDSVRVTVTMNPDGSKTVYETNGATHRSVATTTDAKGKARGRIIYQLDNEGRYESGTVFNASGKFRFKTLYRYDSGGRLSEETQLAKDGTVLHKIVYSFDADGHPSGYSIYDGAGTLLGRTTPATGAPPARGKR